MPASTPESYVGASGGEISAGKFKATPSSSRYKTQAESLFYDAPLGAVVSGGLAYTLGRESVANPRGSYLWASYGPHRDYVEHYSQWSWDNQGGDWLDSAGVSQGTAAAWSFSATAVTSGEHTYTVDMTAALQQAYSLNTWNAWIVRCAQNRMWGTRHHTAPPVLSVTYTDTTSEVLKCLASAGMPGGTAYSFVGIPTANLWGNNGVLEFARPRKPVLSATMQFTITSHIAGAATVSGFLCNPPINPGTQTTGLASAYLHDDGIATNPDVWFAQSYVDGTSVADYVVENTVQHNHGYMSEWSPDMFGIGAADTSKLPYSWRGIDLTNKFIHGARGAVPPVVVSSSYTGEGFTPVAPGIGALKVVTPGNHAADGAVVGSAGSLGADMWAFLQEPDSGLLDDMYVRYRIMFAPYPREGVAQTKMYRSGAGGTAEYMMPRGKSGVAPQAWSDFGGNNRIGGGNLGWSSRGIYTSPMDMDANTVFFGWHSLDMWYGNDPAGTQGGCVWGGQQDGFGTRLKRGVWYDIETRLKLNTWNTTWDTAPSNDGVFQMWIDGVLVIDFQNFSFRQGPLNYDNPADVNSAVYRGYTPTGGTYHPPFRQLGHVGLWINDYQGGVISCEHDQTVFYSNIVASKSRIGPVNFEPPPPPIALVGNAWTPNRNTDLTILDTDWEQLPLNQYVYVEAPTLLASGAIETPHYTAANSSDSALGIINTWSGAAWNANAQEMFISGGGHLATSSCETGIYRLKANTLLFDRAKDREPQSENGSWNYAYPPVFTPGENWQSVILKNSQHGAIHTYWGIVWVPPEVMAVIRGDNLNVSGGIFLTNIIRYVYDLDTREYVGVPSWRPAAGQEIDISDSTAFIDGSNFYGCHHSFDIWKWAAAGTQSTYWSPASTGVFTKTYRSWDLIVSSHSVWGWLPERREVFGFYGSNSNGLLTFRRGRYGQAIDAAASNWGLYVNSITLTSSDGSHLDFNRDNLQSDTTPGGYLYGAASIYDHSTETLYIQGVTVGSLMYKVTGIATNTWTTEYVAGTGALEWSNNGVFGRMRMATLGGKKVMIRVSAVNTRTQVMRIS